LCGLGLGGAVEELDGEPAALGEVVLAGLGVVPVEPPGDVVTTATVVITAAMMAPAAAIKAAGIARFRDSSDF
jgi:hypothetical protein